MRRREYAPSEYAPSEYVRVLNAGISTAADVKRLLTTLHEALAAGEVSQAEVALHVRLANAQVRLMRGAKLRPPAARTATDYTYFG